MISTVIFINSFTALSEIKYKNLENSILVFRNNKIQKNLKKFNNKKYFLSKNRFKYFLEIFCFALFIKIKNQKILIFHDSHWLILDFFINFFRIEGDFIKIAYLDLNNKDIFKKIDNFFMSDIKINFIKKIFYFLLSKSILVNFDFFTRVGFEFVIITRIKKYNKLKLKKKKITQNQSNIFNKNILFLGSGGFVSKQYHIYFYSKIVSYLSKKNFKFFFKDHPVSTNRIAFSHPKVTKLKSEIPIELISKKFQFVIGFDSFSLVSLKSKTISLLHFLPNKKYYRFSKKYFSDSRGTKVHFPKDINNLYKIF